MPSSLLKSYYAEGNPSTLYIKGVQFFFSFGLKEEGLSLMKRAADAGYERVVYTHAMTRAIFFVMCSILLVFQEKGRVRFSLCSVVLQMPMCNTCGATMSLLVAH
ncbi:hypothetical protein F2Q68_00008562 [Brassica cretica]|uniref:Uncharacterized protein n=1 Tax=Brassica cretica TaxID=69181 RepID=A0A8S9KTJ1_BRACR|nr:hypothetical protein F2Q68_00008562 [Brassica cretica]